MRHAFSVPDPETFDLALLLEVEHRPGCEVDRAQLVTSLGRLPLSDQLLLSLLYVANLSLPDVARTLDLSVSDVLTRYGATMKRLGLY